jgi:hypothetical protein
MKRDTSTNLRLRAQHATPPPPSWWADPSLTWQQWSERQREADKRMNATSTNQAVVRKAGDR